MSQSEFRAVSSVGSPATELPPVDSRYRQFFELFNGELFFEAHEVLEGLWLTDRSGVNGAFYKGLIQLAAAFVHLKKNRLRPAAALFIRVKFHLEKYPPRHERLDVLETLKVASDWLERLEESRFEVNPLGVNRAPKLALLAFAAGEAIGR